MIGTVPRQSDIRVSVWRLLWQLLRRPRLRPWREWERVSAPWERRRHVAGTSEALSVTCRVVRRTESLCYSSYSRMVVAGAPPPAALPFTHILETRGAASLGRCAQLGLVAVRVEESGTRRVDHVIVVGAG